MTSDLVPTAAQAVVSTAEDEERDTALQLVLDLERAGAITAVSLDLSDPHMPWERYVALGRMLGAVKRRTSWWIGDWLNFGEGVYGEKYAQAATATGLAPETLMNYAWVCRSIPKSRRVAGVGFGVHAEVASLGPDEQREWLAKATEGDLTRDDLRRAIKAAKLGDGEDGGEGGDGERLSPREALLQVARAIWNQAQPDGDSYRVPREPIQRLAAILGEGE